jgi:hypothetical protein
VSRRPPVDCPVCSDRLTVTQLGCTTCGTGLTGSFASCDFCALDAAQLDVLRVFLASRGNMRELERHLGVSYPTARARFDDVLKALGIAATPAATPAAEDPVPQGAAGPAGEDSRLAALKALATGELDVDQAGRTLLG